MEAMMTYQEAIQKATEIGRQHQQTAFVHVLSMEDSLNTGNNYNIRFTFPIERVPGTDARTVAIIYTCGTILKPSMGRFADAMRQLGAR
jgi:hypothetical protein